MSSRQGRVLAEEPEKYPSCRRRAREGDSQVRRKVREQQLDGDDGQRLSFRVMGFDVALHIYSATIEGFNAGYEMPEGDDEVSREEETLQARLEREPYQAAKETIMDAALSWGKAVADLDGHDYRLRRR